MKDLHDFDATVDLALDVADVTALEQRIAASGTSLSVLMARAGAALAELVESIAPLEHEHQPGVTVLCGSGNNGGDGWVCARILAQKGYPVTLVPTRAAAEVKAQPARDAAAKAQSALESAGCPVLSPDADEAAAAIARADIVVDALLGTGFSGGAVTGGAARLIEAANASTALVVAADVPSGLSAQTGEPATPCARADYTVTMICAKTGLAANRAACGRLLVAPLGVDARHFA